MADNAVFIFVAAGNCGGCIRFKQLYWDKTEKELAKIKGLTIKKVEIPKLGDPLPPGQHKDLSRFVAWYPTFILASKSSLTKDKLEAVVFNGVESKDVWNLVPIGQRKPTDDVSILAWVKDQLANNPLFKKGVTFGSLGTKSILKPPKSEKGEDSEDDDEIYTATYCQQAFIPYL
jgi:hypothetical protein